MVTGWSSPHTFVRFYNLDVNTGYLVPMFFLFEPAVFFVFWSVIGQIWQQVSLACVVYHSHCVKLCSVE